MENPILEARSATIPGPDPNPRPPHVKFPAGACDCHAHVFGPQATFPYVAHAAYIPPDALAHEYARMLRTIGCERAVLVQPSIYATDNRCMVAAMKSGIFDFCGVAVIDDRTSREELRALHEAGVRGARLNLASKTKSLSLTQVAALGERVKPLGWHLQLYVHFDDASTVEQEIARLTLPCVIDHFAGVKASAGVESPGFATLLRLARREHVWFKLMGPYRISTQWPLHPDVAPMVQALVAAAPERCVWGTDWPHPNTPSVPNDGDLADALAQWIPDPAARHRVLVDNPARLYGFK